MPQWVGEIRLVKRGKGRKRRGGVCFSKKRLDGPKGRFRMLTVRTRLIRQMGGGGGVGILRPGIDSNHD